MFMSDADQVYRPQVHVELVRPWQSGWLEALQMRSRPYHGQGYRSKSTDQGADCCADVDAPEELPTRSIAVLLQ